MVRNTTGGSKTKSFARKSVTAAVVADYKPTDELERVATVTKMYGNGMCQVLTQDAPQLDLMCHIRGKFRGRSKKHNMIGLNSKVVVGLRDWESPYKNSDLISVLSTYQDSCTNFNDHHSNENDSFVFSNEETPDVNEILPQRIPTKTLAEYNEEDEINIDDI